MAIKKADLMYHPAHQHFAMRTTFMGKTRLYINQYLFAAMSYQVAIGGRISIQKLY